MGRRGGAKKTALVVLLLMIWVFCSTVAAQVFVGVVMGLLLGPKLLEPVWNGICTALSYAITLALVILVPPRINAKCFPVSSREQLGLSGWPTWTDIGLSPIGYFVTAFVASGLLWIFSLMPWFDANEVQDLGYTTFMSAPEKIIAFLALVVIAPIAEEVIFRGWLYGKMRARLNAPIAVILVSLLFALLHFQWNVGVTVFVLSVVLCVMREVTGTIYAGILTHMIQNGVAFYMLYVAGM